MLYHFVFKFSIKTELLDQNCYFNKKLIAMPNFLEWIKIRIWKLKFVSYFKICILFYRDSEDVGRQHTIVICQSANILPF